MNNDRYHWFIVQDGQLPLQPDGSRKLSLEHRCTITLVWPEGKRPVPANTLLVDPCFSNAGYTEGMARLAERGIALQDIGRVLVTHLHGDHMLHTPYDIEPPKMRPLRSIPEDDPLHGLHLETLDGHAPLLIAPVFTDTAGQCVWVASDAVLGESWLRHWRYYWPNGYSPAEIVATWRSVARILANADLIIPGHGAPFPVTADLLRGLITTFPNAEHADRCPDVVETLKTRLAALTAVAP